MTESDSWNRLESIFHAAMELPPTEREAFVERACAGDEDLRRQVVALIAADEGGGIDLGAVVAGAASEVLETQVASMAGRRFGPYRIVREIGSGGMGTVFLAERADDEFEKRVAIKIVRGGIADSVGRRRFEFERQVLASLEHPGIARLLDGGTTPDGVPFVVMEFVDGRPITTWADTRGLDTPARLWLFLEVCDAVQHAHNALVIHRDLKPDNILVTGDGRPKLLDFGIAKLLEDDRGRTLTGTPQPLTPEYASPEQVRGEKIGTGTDVYALGVLLYELLSGSLPFDLSDETAASIERLITTREPPPPSRVAGSSRALDRDLDSIVLMAMRKDAARRYASVAHLADDVRAYLTGRPVAARPDSLGYRTGKFVRRNRLGVGAAAAILVILAGSALRLAAERDAARLEAARAEQVTGFVTGLFELADPDRARGAEITARELLDRGLDRLRTELAGQPEIRSTMFTVVGDVYTGLGLDVDAEPVLREALAVAIEAHGSESSEAMTVRGLLDDVLSRQGELDEAAELAERVLAFRRDEASDDPRALLGALHSLGTIRRTRGEHERAFELADEMLELAGRLEGHARDSVTAMALNNRGLLHLDAGRLEEAAADLSRSLDIELGTRHPDHSQVLTAKNNLATAYIRGGELDEAERLLREVAAAEARALGERHRNVGTTLHNLSVVLKEKGDFDEAERVQERALEIHLETRGERAPIVASAYNNLANLREELGDPMGAIAWHEKALDLSESLFGPESEQASLTYYNLGGAYRAAGDLVRAEEFQRRALEVDRAVLGPDHPYLVQDLRSLAVTLQDLERLDEAERLMDEALALAGRVHASDHPELARSRNALAELYLETGRPAEAAGLCREALGALLTTLDSDHWEIGNTESLLGEALWRSGEREEATRRLRLGYAKLRDARGDDHPLALAAAARLERAGLAP